MITGRGSRTIPTYQSSGSAVGLMHHNDDNQSQSFILSLQQQQQQQHAGLLRLVMMMMMMTTTTKRGTTGVIMSCPALYLPPRLYKLFTQQISAIVLKPRRAKASIHSRHIVISVLLSPRGLAAAAGRSTIVELERTLVRRF